MSVNKRTQAFAVRVASALNSLICDYGEPVFKVVTEDFDVLFPGEPIALEIRESVKRLLLLGTNADEKTLEESREKIRELVRYIKNNF